MTWVKTKSNLVLKGTSDQPAAGCFSTPIHYCARRQRRSLVLSPNPNPTCVFSTTTSRAAELLNNAATELPTNLGGFAQFASGISFPSTASGMPSPEPDTVSATANLDPEVVVILKKLSKR